MPQKGIAKAENKQCFRRKTIVSLSEWEHRLAGQSSWSPKLRNPAVWFVKYRRYRDQQAVVLGLESFYFPNATCRRHLS